MEFYFSEEKAKEYGLSASTCYYAIHKYMEKRGIYPISKGIFIAPISQAFAPFSNLALELPKHDWFMACIDKWYWFDYNSCVDYDDPAYDCLNNEVKLYGKDWWKYRQKRRQNA